MTHRHLLAPVLAALLAGSVLPRSASALDAAAAEALMEKSGCFKCHSADQAKAGPAYREVARKYKGQADAPDKLYKHATTRPIVKVDGNLEEHATLKSKNPAEIRNAIAWILTR